MPSSRSGMTMERSMEVWTVYRWTTIGESRPRRSMRLVQLRLMVSSQKRHIHQRSHWCLPNQLHWKSPSSDQYPGRVPRMLYTRQSPTCHPPVYPRWMYRPPCPSIAKRSQRAYPYPKKWKKWQVWRFRLMRLQDVT